MRPLDLDLYCCQLRLWLNINKHCNCIDCFCIKKYYGTPVVFHQTFLLVTHTFKEAKKCISETTNVHGESDVTHGDVIKWNIFRVTGHLCGEITGDKGQWRGAWMFSLICAINGWVNNGEAGDLRHNPADYDVIVMRYFSRIGWIFGLGNFYWNTTVVIFKCI